MDSAIHAIREATERFERSLKPVREAMEGLRRQSEQLTNIGIAEPLLRIQRDLDAIQKVTLGSLSEIQKMLDTGPTGRYRTMIEDAGRKANLVRPMALPYEAQVAALKRAAMRDEK